MTKITNFALILYGIMCIYMGVQAAFYPHEGVKASITSLYAAGSLGVFMLATVYIAWLNPRGGRLASAVLALVALVRFSRKYLEDHTMYPGGIVVYTSIAVLVLLLLDHLASLKNQKPQPSE